MSNPTTLPEGAHLDGCPASPDRQEAFEHVSSDDGSRWWVVRCCDCGEQQTYNPEEATDATR